MNFALCVAVRQVYVQDLIQANGAKLWPLFEAGAVVYVCGDARRMVRVLSMHAASSVGNCSGVWLLCGIDSSCCFAFVIHFRSAADC